jgi:hypothetical protein
VSALVADAMAVQELPGQQKRFASGGIALGDANSVTMSEPRRLCEQRRLSAAAPADAAAACRGGRIGPGSVEPVAVFPCWPDGHPELCRTLGGQVKDLRARGGEKNRVLRITPLREQHGQEVNLSGGERNRKQGRRDAAGQGDGLARLNLSDRAPPVGR